MSCTCRPATRFHPVQRCEPCSRERFAKLVSIVGLVYCADCGEPANAARGRCSECFRVYVLSGRSKAAVALPARVEGGSVP